MAVTNQKEAGSISRRTGKAVGLVIPEPLLAADRSRGANSSAALSGDHAAESGPDLSGTGFDAGERARQQDISTWHDLDIIILH